MTAILDINGVEIPAITLADLFATEDFTGYVNGELLKLAECLREEFKSALQAVIDDIEALDMMKECDLADAVEQIKGMLTALQQNLAVHGDANWGTSGKLNIDFPVDVMKRMAAYGLTMSMCEAASYVESVGKDSMAALSGLQFNYKPEMDAQGNMIVQIPHPCSSETNNFPYLNEVIISEGSVQQATSLTRCPPRKVDSVLCCQ